MIYLKAGLHTEDQGIIIDKPVKIIGEAGAVLQVQSAFSLVDTVTGTLPLHVGLHLRNAPGTLLQDITIEPLGADGGTAILIENSPHSAVIHSTITGHQFSIILEKSDRVAIMRNTIVASGAWQTGAISEAHGIIIMNGKSAYVSDNDVSNALFGIWACDKWGSSERNNTHGNYIGLILCKVPQGFQLPGGEVTGSEFSGALWKVRQNQSAGNFNVGYLVIDGANNNLLENNEAGNNGAYDYELVGDSYRFGFLTPLSFDNTVYATPGQTVKNCGLNNSVIGGNQVDTGVDACN